MNEWISVKEAAKIMGYSPAYFRELFCQTDKPLVTIRQKRCPSGRRRILVLRESVENVVSLEVIAIQL